jgi:hypothetical protein
VCDVWCRRVGLKQAPPATRGAAPQVVQPVEERLPPRAVGAVQLARGGAELAGAEAQDSMVGAAVEAAALQATQQRQHPPQAAAGEESKTTRKRAARDWKALIRLQERRSARMQLDELGRTRAGKKRKSKKK